MGTKPFIIILIRWYLFKIYWIEFELGGRAFDKVWFLVDGSYPEIGRFSKTLEEAVGEDRKMYVRWQEACRKSIERAFGVIQSKFQVLQKGLEDFYSTTMNNIVFTAIILHNMMVSHRVEQGETKS